MTRLERATVVVKPQLMQRSRTPPILDRSAPLEQQLPPEPERMTPDLAMSVAVLRYFHINYGGLSVQSAAPKGIHPRTYQPFWAITLAESEASRVLASSEHRIPFIRRRPDARYWTRLQDIRDPRLLTSQPLRYGTRLDREEKRDPPPEWDELSVTVERSVQPFQASRQPRNMPGIRILSDHQFRRAVKDVFGGFYQPGMLRQSMEDEPSLFGRAIAGHERKDLETQLSRRR
ncbi:uncharacterized protein L969DRAFT_51838 [Mixia osmundae IAM 14324]|uniref:Uncharacterized protein n=1 Tax=Mixia osmundae (strain CBS 9802 / IAM 14324 / JCM 22182 / KY 12970) TaxID=764103 RepID=G7EAC3_MIXOS|nr:uncharacterized protein L969DRAFT_51838 [Mixia osmundae IAM 14324]KEI37842.1 hypothetical protein L969DRAFT_51838 [Mixia osmundae IAM 14324]GAA99783.1 hypothetical protein E5Q_06487 [Mixia osmundae IAM 14324]